MKDIVIFDFFGVVCSEVAPYWITENLPELDEKKLHETHIRDVDLGKSEPEELFEYLGQLSNLSVAEVADGWQQYININKDLVEYIKKLKETKRIALCSNAWTEFIRPILDRNNLNDLFEVIVISSEIGHTKPDQEMYLETCKRLAVDPGQCIFIDDNQKNVDAAIGLGMQGYLYTTVEDLKKSMS